MNHYMGPAWHNRHHCEPVEDDDLDDSDLLPFDRVVGRLNIIPNSRRSIVTNCPAHRDKSPSLSVTEGADARALLHCFAGCSLERICSRLRLRVADLFPRRFGGSRPRRYDPIGGDLADLRRQWTPPTYPDFSSSAAQNVGELTKERLDALSTAIGVSSATLTKFSVGWHGGAWTIPERHSDGRIIGLALRHTSGQKSFIPGGKRGLIIPAGWNEQPGPVYVAEGFSDTAALIDRGLCAIGRPNADCGEMFVAGLLCDFEREIIVVADNDPEVDGRSPGKEGARKFAAKLSDDLDRPIKITTPPSEFKDVRGWLTEGR